MKNPSKLALAAMAALSCAGVATAQSINAAGATFPEFIYKKWFSDYRNAHAGIEINYQAIGSGGGIKQLTQATVDFGASDRPLTDAEMADPALKIKPIYFPTVLGGIVPAYNLPGVSAQLKFTGEVLDEMYVPLGQLDYSAELTRIAAAKPDAVFAFLPGGMGVNFVKQYRQAGLADKIPFLSAFTVDESTLPAQQDAALGMYSGANWAPNLDNPQNKAFVDAYLKEYNAVPATYAFQAYDTALLIDSAVRAVRGNLADKDALRAALQKADFKSLRGNFKFNTNHYPIQNFYLAKVAKRPDGKYETEIVKTVFSNYGDSYAKDCPMK